MNWPALRPELPNVPQRSPPTSNDVDAVVARVGDVARARRHRRRCRAGTAAGPARSRTSPSAPGSGSGRGPEAHDAVVGVVGHVQPAARRRPRRRRDCAAGRGRGPGPEPTVRMKRPPVSNTASRWWTSSATISRDPRTAIPWGRESRPGRHDHRAARAVRGEALDAVVARVGDVHHPVGDRDAAARAGRVAAARAEAELAGLRAGRAPAVEQRARRRRSGRSGRCRRRRRSSRPRPRRPRRPRSARAAPGGRADLARGTPVGAEDLDRVRVLIGDVHRAVGPDGDGLRKPQDAGRALPDRRGRRVGARVGAGAGRGARGRGDQQRDSAASRLRYGIAST